jgi:hypothetical protein
MIEFPNTFLPKATYRFDPTGRSFMNGHIYPEFCNKTDRAMVRSLAEPLLQSKVVIQPQASISPSTA